MTPVGPRPGVPPLPLGQGGYSVAIVLGPVNLTAALKAQLIAFASGGGHVIVAAGVAGPGDGDLTGLASLLPELRAKINALVRELGARSPGMEFKLEQGVVRYAEMGSFASGEICQRCQRAADIVGDLADLAEVFTDQKPGN